MSILEPRVAHDAEDPMLDAVLGLYSTAHRARAALERLAPAHGSDAYAEALPEPFLALLLGIVSASATLERVVGDACPPPNAKPKPAEPAPSRGSVWR